jgi:hypothetical protein
MSLRLPLRLLGLAALALLLGGGCVWSFSSNTSGNDPNGNGQGGTIIIISNATFGGSGFAPLLADLPGVTRAQTGWEGNGPFFGAWLAGWTGHRPVSRISFDTGKLTLAQLLAAARERSTGRWVNFYARDEAQATEARKAWPAHGTPELFIRRAAGFISAAE